MYNNQFIVTRDGSQYNRKYYRLEGNMLQVQYTELHGTNNALFPTTRWKDVREIEV